MDQTLGDRIRRAREALHLSQGALAQLVGVSQRTVGNWERGETVPQNRMGALENELGVDLRTGEQLEDRDPVYLAVRRSGLTRSAQLELLSHYERLRSEASTVG